MAEYRDLLSEFNLLKDVNHNNVIRLIGVCSRDGLLCFSLQGLLSLNVVLCAVLWSSLHSSSHTFGSRGRGIHEKISTILEYIHTYIHTYLKYYSAQYA